MVPRITEIPATINISTLNKVVGSGSVRRTAGYARVSTEKENGKYQLFSGILYVHINKNSKNFFYDITKISESRMASGKPLSEPLENSDIL